MKTSQLGAYVRGVLPGINDLRGMHLCKYLIANGLCVKYLIINGLVELAMKKPRLGPRLLCFALTA